MSRMCCSCVFKHKENGCYHVLLVKVNGSTFLSLLLLLILRSDFHTKSTVALIITEQMCTLELILVQSVN